MFSMLRIIGIGFLLFTMLWNIGIIFLLLLFTMLRFKALVLYNVEEYRNNISLVAVYNVED